MPIRWDDSIKLRSLSGLWDQRFKRPHRNRRFGYRIPDHESRGGKIINFPKSSRRAEARANSIMSAASITPNEGDRSTNNVESHRINANSIADPSCPPIIIMPPMQNINYHPDGRAGPLLSAIAILSKIRKSPNMAGVFSFSTNLNSDLPGIGFKQGGPSYLFARSELLWNDTERRNPISADRRHNGSMRRSTRGFQERRFSIRPYCPPIPGQSLWGSHRKKLTSYEGGRQGPQWLDRRPAIQCHWIPLRL